MNPVEEWDDQLLIFKSLPLNLTEKLHDNSDLLKMRVPSERK
jgi:hypothetical protein